MQVELTCKDQIVRFITDLSVFMRCLGVRGLYGWRSLDRAVAPLKQYRWAGGFDVCARLCAYVSVCACECV